MVTTGPARSLASSAALAPSGVASCREIGTILATGLRWLVTVTLIPLRTFRRISANRRWAFGSRYGVFDRRIGHLGVFSHTASRPGFAQRTAPSRRSSRSARAIVGLLTAGNARWRSA